MDLPSVRGTFDWCNYQAAVLSGTLVAAVAAASTFTLAALVMSPHPVTDMSLIGALKYLLVRAFALPFTFFIFFLFGAVVTLAATIVFGSLTLMLVRGTKLESVWTFGAAGFVSGYLMMIAFAHANAGVNLESVVFALVGGLAGLAGGCAFGYRICFPVSMECGLRPTPADETLLSRIIRFLLAR